VSDFRNRIGIRCDVCDRLGIAGEESERELRKRLSERGWHVTPGNRDVCARCCKAPLDAKVGT
jgi:hypothetical protein